MAIPAAIFFIAVPFSALRFCFLPHVSGCNFPRKIQLNGNGFLNAE
jgi:hypothetical protein